jgi:nicotinamidase-related amidase
MSAPWLVVVDMQNVFADRDSPWYVPRFHDVIEPIEELVAAHAPRVTFTRFIAPAEPEGGWVRYYEQWAFALQPPDAELYRLVPRLAGHAAGGSLDATTFSKWTPELAAMLRPDDELVVAGVATDACVIGTALAAADAGVRVRIAADACAGVDDAAHERSIAVMRLWAPLIEVTTTADLLGRDATPVQPGGA